MQLGHLFVAEKDSAGALEAFERAAAVAEELGELGTRGRAEIFFSETSCTAVAANANNPRRHRGAEATRLLWIPQTTCLHGISTSWPRRRRDPLPTSPRACPPGTLKRANCYVGIAKGSLTMDSMFRGIADKIRADEAAAAEALAAAGAAGPASAPAPAPVAAEAE